MSTYYEILGVDSKASTQEIKSAYRKLIKIHHPDYNPNKADAILKTQVINEAWHVLGDSVRRLEYDNLLSLKNSPECSNTQTSNTKNYSEIHSFHCEKCGRQDPTLRVVIFLWVLSLFVVTYKKGWGHILCSRCRIKYSILFNIEVWFLGWWGFPWGPVYSLEALLNNLRGGMQPLENNVNLLSVLGYDFYRQGRYKEAFETLSKSYDLKPSKEIKDFLNHIKSYSPFSQNHYSFFDKVFSVNPAWYNTLVIIALIIFSFGFFDGNSSLSSANTSTPVSVIPSNENTSVRVSDISTIQAKDPKTYISSLNGTVLSKNSYYLKGLGQIKIDNGTSLDAIAKLVNVVTNKSIFTVYIKANSTYEINKVSDGDYKLFFNLGNNWDTKAKAFTVNSSYEVFEDSFDFTTSEYEEGDYINTRYATFDVTLNPVVGGQAKTNGINAVDFGKY